MRIFSVNPSVISQSSKPTFKGLWGKPEVNVVDNTNSDYGQMVDMGEKLTTITKLYYPFADETSAEIRKVVKENTEHEVIEPNQEEMNERIRKGYWVDDVTYINDTKVKVLSRLKFTAKEFAAYQARELLSKAENALEDALKLSNLQHYLRR